MPVELSAEVKFAVSVPRTPQVMAWMQQAMRKSVASLRRRAEANLSGRFLRVRTGHGLRSLRSNIRQGRNEIVGRVGSPVFYLRILHTGFPAQTLRTEKKPGFAFAGPNGRIIRTQTIQHPGVSARPWLQVALQESREDIAAAFNEVPANIAGVIRGRAA